MDYEKAYKEALGRAKEEISKQGMKNDVMANHLVGVIFPELKESEDETIRKKLLKLFNDMERDDSILDDYSLDKVRTINWLEKQSQTFTKKDVDDAWLKGMCDAKHELEKQGEHEYALKSSNTEDVHRLMEQITKLAKDYELNLPNRSYDIYAFAKDILAWIEKQKKSPDPLEKVSKEAFKNIPTVNPEVLNFKMPRITGITWGGEHGLNDFYLDEGKNWKIRLDNGKAEKKERLIDKLKDLPMEYPLYSPQYGVIYLAEVDRVDDIITCYKHKLPEGATRAEIAQEDTVSFYGDGEAGDEDFNVSKQKQVYLFEELF